MSLVSHMLISQHPIMTIGQRIKQARRSLNLTQRELADRLHVDTSTVGKWETDPSRRPSRDLMPNIAKVLHRSIAWLEGRPGASDRDYGYEDDKLRDLKSPAITIDQALLREVIEMAMRSLVSAYGVELSKQKLEDAADAAASSYVNYFKLKERDDAA
jgi:transcriptional regulator with XRE-family HTH domain